MTIAEIQAFLDEHDYDVRASHNGRWIDQKCTFDVLCFVADQIVRYVENARVGEFTSVDVWKSELAIQAVQQDFVKPNPLGEPSHDEYNKFYRQPMKLLSAAGVLSERREGQSIVFSIRDRSVLDFIAQRDPDAFQFLVMYVEKVLRDSGLWDLFERYFDVQSAMAFGEVKEAFRDFELKYTPIKNIREADRIFAKVLNPLAFYRHAKGAVRGRISQCIITKAELVYNRPNWRDERLGKNKNVARREYVPESDIDRSLEYRIQKTVQRVRSLNDAERDGKSEVLDWGAAGHRATQAHHMFPKAKVPEIAAVPENIIMLTSAQHMERAHPEGNTSIIDVDYQRVCLRSKLATIERLTQDARIDVSSFYSIDRFIKVLNSGFETEYFSAMPTKDGESILGGIDLFYPLSE